MTATDKRVVLTIITESALESSLLEDLVRMGAQGYTVTDARGRGSRGVRDAQWDEAANIRIEVVCARPLAQELFAHLRDSYYDDYAMIAFMHEVDVLRPEKFGAG